MRGWKACAVAIAAILVAGAVGSCGDDDGGQPLAVHFGDSDRDGVRDGHLTPEQAERMSDDDLLIVSIGDSVAAGEGNPDVEGRGLAGGQRWTLRRCHRSLWSGHAEAADDAERDDEQTDVGFVPLGCSGATIEKGLLGSYRGIDPALIEMREPPQVDRVNALAEKREIDALLLSVGANDVNFSKIVSFCLRFDECWRRPFDPDAWPLFAPSADDPREPDGRRRTLEEVVKRRLAALPEAYARFDTKLSDDIPRGRVVIVEYFDSTTGPSPRGPAPCRWEHGIGRIRGVITPDEFRWAQREVLQPLNAAVHAAADAHGWRVVGGVSRRFAGHGICAGADRWVRDLDESLVVQGLNHTGTLHPNRAGHRETGDLIEPVLAEVLAGSR